MKILKKYRLKPQLRNLFLLLVMFLMIQLIYVVFFIDEFDAVNYASLEIEDAFLGLMTFVPLLLFNYCLYNIGKYYLNKERLYTIQHQKQHFHSQINHLSQIKKEYYQDILSKQENILKLLDQDEMKTLENMIYEKNILFCHNEIIDTVLSSKYQIMKENHIDFYYDIKLPQSFHIKDIDIATIFLIY